MQLSDLLVKKLNSDEELLKRIQLAKNVFISSDLKIAYKEEQILLWFFKRILNAKDEKEKKELVKGLCFCVDSDNMAVLSASGIRANVKSKMSKHLSEILRAMENPDESLNNSVLIILKKFFLHFKSHPKQFVKIIYALLSLHPCSSQYAQILNLALEIFKSDKSYEKFMLYVLEKDFHILFEDINGTKGETLIRFLQGMLFRKEIFIQCQMAFHSVLSNHEFTSKSPIISSLITSLHEIHHGDISIKVKTEAFCKVFESFMKTCDKEDDATVLQCFLVLCHILGVEQTVCFLSSAESDTELIPVINGDSFQAAFNISSPILDHISFMVVRSLIEYLNERSVNLNTRFLDATYLQWFQSLVLVTVGSGKELSKVHLDFVLACAYLDTSTVEKSTKKILTCLLRQPPAAFEEEDFREACIQFIDGIFKMYCKLQRLQKFTTKLIQSLENAKPALPLKCIMSDSFITNFSDATTLLTSSKSLSFMDYLLNALDCHCVQILEKNTEPINALLVQVICALLGSFLSGVRVLNHTTPKTILESFVEKMKQLKIILGRFGRALLVRIHDRDIVQPFLNLTFYWGEIELLIMNYAEEYSEQLVNKDISPTDLSALHSYLSGEEWNVLAERITNFGAVQCYQLLLKLVLQKLRVLLLMKCPSLINGDATSKYILIHLTSELYKHNIVEDLTPEDFSYVLTYLSQTQIRLLLEKLYCQIFELEEGQKIKEWIGDSMLVENPNFVTLSLMIIFQKIGSKLSSFCKHNGSCDAAYSSLGLDLVDENYNVHEVNFSKLVESLNEILCSDNEIVINSSHLESNAKLLQLKTCIEIIKFLPIAYMSREFSKLALTGCTFIAVVLSNFDDLLEPLLFLIYGFLLNTGKKDSGACFNVGLCIKWLLDINSASANIRNMKNLLVKFMLQTGTSTDKGLKEIKQLIDLVRKKKRKNDAKALESHVLLYQDLGKSWVKARKRQLESNAEIATCRKKLSKRIRKELEKQNELDTPTVDSDILIRAYGLELTKAIKLQKDDKIADVIKLNFDKFLDTAISKVKNGSEDESYVTFLCTLLTHMPQIRNHIDQNILKKIWKALKTGMKVDWKLFYRMSTDMEFRFFLLDLLKTWKAYASGKNKRVNLETYFDIWKGFYTEELGNKKVSYEKCLENLFFQFSMSGSPLDVNGMVHLLKFLQFCISTSEIAMTSAMLDISFDVIYSYEFQDSWSTREFQTVFEWSVTTTSWLLSTRWVRSKDRIHNIFLVFTKLLNRLATRSSLALHLSDDDIQALTSCAFNMEKWTSKMVKWSKDFGRVSVYFIGEIICSFVRVGIYPDVKSHLVNCINNFLNVSDAYNVAYLARALNPGCQQVFNDIYETYKKYYKFTGKV